MKMRFLLLALVLTVGIWSLGNGIDYFLIKAGVFSEFLSFKGIYREVWLLGDVTLAILVGIVIFYRILSRQEHTHAELKTAHDQLKLREEQLRKVNQQLLGLNRELKASKAVTEAGRLQAQASEQQIRKAHAELAANHAALVESTTRFQKMTDNVPGVVYQFLMKPDGAMSFPYASEKCRELIGVDAAVIQQDSAVVFGFIHPDDRGAFYASINASARELKPWHWGGRFLVCGTMKWLQGAAQPVRQPDGSILWDGLITDVTDLKRAEQALQQSKQMLQLVLNTIPSAVFWKDRESVYLGANRVFLNKIGLNSAEQIIRKTDLDLAGPEQAAQYRADDRQVMETKTPKMNYEEQMIQADRSLRWLRASKVPLCDPEGRVIGVLGTYEDITERKLADAAINESEQRFKAIFDNAADGILLIDPETKKIHLGNNAICEMLGYTPEMIARMQVADIHPETARPHVMEQFGKHVRREIKISSNLPVKRRDGSVIYADVTAFFITLSGKTYLAGMFRDITERKKADDRIRASLREKEVLLKEIHHRVKNNLQVISSLLNLQSQYIADPRDFELFRESQMRLRTMSLIHEKLYQSSDLAQTNFAEYLTQLTAELLRSYKTHEVRIAVEVESHILLGIDLAIPCALIIHELMSNALKHAFAAAAPATQAKGRKGHPEICIVLREDSGAGFLLIASDNGVGLPPHIEAGHTRSLGWQLITALTAQIHGRLEIDRSHGTAVSIRLPKETPSR